MSEKEEVISQIDKLIDDIILDIGHLNEKVREMVYVVEQYEHDNDHKDKKFEILKKMISKLKGTK